MNIIIRDPHIASSEAEHVADKVGSKLHEVSALVPELPAAVNLPSNPDDPYSPATVPTTDPGKVIKPEVQKAPAAVGIPDGIIERIRKYIPSEAAVAWGVIKRGFESAYPEPGAGELPQSDLITYFVVWGVYVVLVFVYMLLSLYRERSNLKFEKVVTMGDIVIHAFVSTFAFVVYSSTLGAPFSYTSMQQWLPYAGIGVFVLFASVLPSPYFTPKPAAGSPADTAPQDPEAPEDSGKEDSAA